MNNSKSISIIEEHPLPTTEEEANEMQAVNPTFSEVEAEQLHPDAFREYQQVIASNEEWRVFALHIYGYESFTYLWNHQLGYGIRFDESGEFESLANVMNHIADVLGVRV